MVLCRVHRNRTIFRDCDCKTEKSVSVHSPSGRGSEERLLRSCLFLLFDPRNFSTKRLPMQSLRTPLQKDTLWTGTVFLVLKCDLKRFRRVTSKGSLPSDNPVDPWRTSHSPAGTSKRPLQRPLRTPLRGKLPRRASRRVVTLGW